MRRRLQYWRALDKAGHAATTPEPFDVVATLEAARTKEIDRHLECRNGMTVLAHPVTRPEGAIVILDRVRTGNYPSAGDAGGNRRPIPLGQDDNLLEPTYVMFLRDGIVALLTGGEGPHAQRLAEYMRRKFEVDWFLEPVLRDDLDEVLAEMRLTELQVSVPVENITRELVGGDWYEALESGSRLADDGVVRIGMSVGRKGDQSFKNRMSARLRDLASELQQSLGLQHFSSAKVRGQRHGHPQTIDLLEDRLVQTVEVEDDQWFDTERSIAYASEVLSREVDRGQFAGLRLTGHPTDGKEARFNPQRCHERDAD